MEEIKKTIEQMNASEKLEQIDNPTYHAGAGGAMAGTRESARFLETKNLAMRKSLLYNVLILIGFILIVFLVLLTAGGLPVYFETPQFFLLGAVLLGLSLLTQRMVRLHTVGKMSSSDIGTMNSLIAEKNAKLNGDTSKKMQIIILLIVIVVFVLAVSFMK